MDDKTSGWLDDCEKIFSLLREGNRKAVEIIGTPIHDQDEPRKEPTTLADKLDMALRDISGEAQLLNEKLQVIVDMF